MTDATTLTLMVEGLTVPAPFALMPVTRLLQPLPAWAKPNHAHFDCQHLHATTCSRQRRQQPLSNVTNQCVRLKPRISSTLPLHADTSRNPCLQGVLNAFTGDAFHPCAFHRKHGSAACSDVIGIPTRLSCSHDQHRLPASHKPVCAAIARSPETRMPALGRHSQSS